MGIIFLQAKSESKIKAKALTFFDRERTSDEKRSHLCVSSMLLCV
jgi:hypothetical protein